MTDEQLIAQQARRIAELEEELSLRNEAEKKIHMEIYGCGGPQNDNVLGYTRDQMVPFARIHGYLGCAF
ncbi:hypothetical protein [Denitromonas sp.]|uniref:hypothetical protein n=1 Tax=Denitromonas sp. TaxID=2734609 RepID=UPI002AFEAB9A|nr:hypothetical protein [Denitromonas sp.]